MNIESFNLVEHFDYLKKYIPQPFYINSKSIVELSASDNGLSIKTDRFTYDLTKSAAKKLVDALGIKLKLFNNEHEESNVLEQVIPVINKLLKCFADCFVFYNSNDSPLEIIDLNINTSCGDEGTIFENGPSPWNYDLNKDSSVFTCFTDFKNVYSISDTSDILVKADDIMTSALNVNMYLFRANNDVTLQPMLLFSSKSSNLSGFTDIKPVVYDLNSDIYIKYPINYKKSNNCSFDEMWDNLLHISSKIDLEDFISREMNELAASKETPSNIKSFISTVLVENTININQPVGMILNEVKNITDEMSPAKAKSFKNKLGTLIGWCLCRKHSSCHECGHIELC